MLFHFFIWVSEYPARADKSAPTAVQISGGRDKSAPTAVQIILLNPLEADTRLESAYYHEGGM